MTTPELAPGKVHSSVPVTDRSHAPIPVTMTVGWEMG